MPPLVVTGIRGNACAGPYYGFQGGINTPSIMTAGSVWTTDSNYPLTNLYDGDVATIHKFTGIPLPVVDKWWYAFDMEQVPWGSFVDAFIGSAPNQSPGTFWDVQAFGTLGTSTRQVDVAPHEDYWRMITGSDAAQATRGSIKLALNAGWKYKLSVEAVAATLHDHAVILRNARTGEYLAPDGSWVGPSVSSSAILANQGGGWIPYSVNFTVPNFSQSRTDRVIFELTLRAAHVPGVQTQVRWDNISIIPYIDFCSLHDISAVPPGVIAEIRSRLTSSTAWATRHTFDMTHQAIQRSGATYAYIAERADRWWGVAFDYTPFNSFYSSPASNNLFPEINDIALGEIVFAHATALPELIISHPHRNPHGLTRNMPQIRHTTPGGRQVVTALARRHRNAVTFPIEMIGDDNVAKVMGELFERSDYGARACVLVPDSADPYVHMGRVQGTVPLQQKAGHAGGGIAWVKANLLFEEDAVASHVA
jgi:hypothetical protein